jgi:hypothetical protein
MSGPAVRSISRCRKENVSHVFVFEVYDNVAALTRIYRLHFNKYARDRLT